MISFLTAQILQLSFKVNQVINWEWKVPIIDIQCAFTQKLYSCIVAVIQKLLTISPFFLLLPLLQYMQFFLVHCLLEFLLLKKGANKKLLRLAQQYLNKISRTHLFAGRNQSWNARKARTLLFYSNLLWILCCLTDVQKHRFVERLVVTWRELYVLYWGKLYATTCSDGIMSPRLQF